MKSSSVPTMFLSCFSFTCDFWYLIPFSVLFSLACDHCPGSLDTHLFTDVVTSSWSPTMEWLHQWAKEVLYLDFLDFCKAFYMVLHIILLSKLEKDGFDGWAVREIIKWLDDLIQEEVVNGSESQRASMTGGVPQGQSWDQRYLISSLMTYKIKCTLNKFGDEIKLSS